MILHTERYNFLKNSWTYLKQKIFTGAFYEPLLVCWNDCVWVFTGFLIKINITAQSRNQGMIVPLVIDIGSIGVTNVSGASCLLIKIYERL